MIKIKYLLIISLLFMTMSCSIQEDRIIVRYTGAGFGSFLYDTTTLQGAVEGSELIVRVRITDMEYILDTSQAFPNIFIYGAEIEKLYYDKDNKFKESDTLKIYTNNGYIKANDYIKSFTPEQIKKYGLVQKEYAENEYYASSMFDSLIPEEGREYILFLTYSDYVDMYIQGSYEIGYEIDGKKFYTNSKRELSENTLAKTEKLIEEAVSARKGIYDEYLH